MQGNGPKLFITAFLILLTGYYLYPSVRAYFLNNSLEGMTTEERAAYEREHYAKIQAVNERALKLGLDLQGGMHTTLELRVDALVRALATDTDTLFENVLEAARRRTEAGNEEFVEVFVSEFEQRDPEARLSRYFRNEDAGVTRRSTNAEVAGYLRAQANDAMDRAIAIIRDRVDRFGVTEPSIQKQGSRRVVVELPGVDDPERVRRLLRGTARLEFHLMADPQELATSLQRVLQHFENTTTDTPADSAAADTAAVARADTAAADSAARQAAASPQDAGAVLQQADSASDAAALLEGDREPESQNALLRVFSPIGQGVIFGAVSEQDTAAVRALLSQPEVRAMLPAGVRLLYTANPEGQSENGQEVFYLLGVRQNVELTGDVITDSMVDFDQFTNQPEVTMVMNAEGASTWSRLTGANINRNIAIVLDDVVYSYPTVISKIVGGRSSITGLESADEATDIVTVLKSGALPAPVEIVNERTVGPSLGQAAINAGVTSFLVGLVLVSGFMIFWYRTGGIAAVIALLLNLFFIFGILAGFGAALTLPGIAGIVLTMGMAVDANVLIFERIREELANGRSLKASIDAGYSKALSAIADGNITTFLIGAILYSFGVGPIQGFAVTLMAGILSSMFTSIVVTRVIFDWLVGERRMAVSYG